MYRIQSWFFVTMISQNYSWCFKKRKVHHANNGRYPKSTIIYVQNLINEYEKLKKMNKKTLSKGAEKKIVEW